MTKANQTKRRLSATLKKMMETQDFYQICVADICKNCGVHRKTFYYHFESKFDLLNWTFRTECVEPALQQEPGSFTEAFGLVLDFMEQDFAFYRRAFQLPPDTAFGTTMYTSFQDHFMEQLKLLYERYNVLETLTGVQLDARTANYLLDTLSGSLMGNVQQWCLEYQKISAREYFALFNSAMAKLFAQRQAAQPELLPQAGRRCPPA